MGTATRATGTGRRAGLDRDEVVDHALALVEAGGAAALTMRKLAADLDVTTTTIYWHVGGRDELVLAVIERIAEHNAAITIEGTTPNERVMSVARAVWATAIEHRNVTALAHQVGATGVLEQHLERAMAHELEQGGLRGPEVRDALRAILMCVAGFLVVAFRSDGGSQALHGSDTGRTDLGEDGLSPETVAAMAERPDLPALFDRTVQAVVDSFLPASATRPTPTINPTRRRSTP